MARIVLGSYVVQFPLGGYLSWVLQWLVGLDELGHDVYFVERASYPGSCFDPERREMTDDPGYGVRTLDSLLTSFDLGGRWCFVDSAGRYYGLSQVQIEGLFETADLFIDMGTHGGWAKEAERASRRVLIDGEPGATQMKMAQQRADGEVLPEYDVYFSEGQSIGTPLSTAPTAGYEWKHVFCPVSCERVAQVAPPRDAAFTTVMSWSAHEPVTWDGVVYGQKDVEFEKFMSLPSLTRQPVELSVAGHAVPRERLVRAGFRLRDAHAVSRTYETFWDYVRGSLGEFSVAKNVFVATSTGWFADRAAAYLAAGRPVVMQETGFSAHLPCGEGLFAVRTAEEAAGALDEIVGDYARHSRAARGIALEYLDTGPVIHRFLADAGVE